jgi:hypothetical protein
MKCEETRIKNEILLVYLKQCTEGSFPGDKAAGA